MFFIFSKNSIKHQISQHSFRKPESRISTTSPSRFEMASEQLRRENVTQERVIIIEKDRVPKMASHFETLAEQTKGPDVHEEPTLSEERQELPSHEYESRFGKVGGVEFGSMGERHAQAQGGKRQEKSAADQVRNANLVAETEAEGEKKRLTFEERPGGVKFEVHGSEHKGSSEEGIQKQQGKARLEREVGMHARQGGEQEAKHGRESSAQEGSEGFLLEEISKHRQSAQQNSMEAIRAAEERYEKAKEKGASGMQNVEELASYGPNDTAAYVTERGGQAKEGMKQGMQTGTQFVSEKAGTLKETALEKGQQGFQATKKTVVPAAQKAKQFVSEKAAGAKDTTSTAASYVQEKASAAKDVTVEGGKGAAGYAGKVAESVKDTAKVAGWGAAHFTLGTTAAATKAVANVAAGVAGYAGDIAVQAKDVVAGAGTKAASYAGDKIAAAKDAVVSTEESAAEYAARKKAEAQRETETKKSPEIKGEKIQSQGEGLQRRAESEGAGMQQQGREVAGKTAEAARDVLEGVTQTIAKPAENAKKQLEQEDGQEQEGAGVLNDIGETIVEIGQTTKELLVGHGQTPMQEKVQSKEE